MKLYIEVNKIVIKIQITQVSNDANHIGNKNIV